MLVTAWRPPAHGCVESSGTPSSATSAILVIAADAQTLQHVHQFAIGHARGRRAGRCGDPCPRPAWRPRRADEIDALDRRLADGDGEIGLDGDVGRLVRLLLRDRGRRRQIDRKIHGRQRRRHHEDDQKHEHHVDERRHIDVVRLVEIVVIVVRYRRVTDRHGLTPPRATSACRWKRSRSRDSSRPTAPDPRPTRSR